MINLISVKNSSVQKIDVSAEKGFQKIVVKNERDQSINVTEKNEVHKIEIFNEDCPQKIGISIPCPCKVDLEVAIDSKVPKALSVLPQTSNESFETVETREASRFYVDADGTPSFANAEQIKQLNTKIILVNELTDKSIDKLSNGDFVLLQERR